MPFGSKTKLISFRVSAEEYDSIHDVCLTNGIRSVSELARAGLTRIVHNSSQLSQELVMSRIADLEARLQILSTEVRNHKFRETTGHDLTKTVFPND